MDRERWQRVDELYHAAMERAAAERAAFLDDACLDPDLRREVESLLSFEAADGSLFDSPAWEKRLSPGERLGPYEIVERAGAGGMGEVWKARDTRLGRDVAIKVCAERFSDRFRREARAIAALNHPHICTLYDIGSDCLVMEYIEGAPIQGPLPLDRALILGAQVADALDAAHRKGIVHRDLKPANILVTNAGVKLLDFGLAKMAPASHAAPAAASHATREGAIAGTLQYMAPEQLQGKGADSRSDIFSFGCVFYELLTGRRAFDGSDAASSIAAILKDEPPPLTPRPLERLVRKCLAKDPDERWQSARDLRDELLWIASGEAQTPAGVATVPKSKLRRRAWIAAVALLAAVAGFALLRMRPSAVPERMFRFPLVLTEGIRDFRISPDGENLVYMTGSDRPAFRVYNLASGESRRLPVLDGAADFFWSPDSRFIGFRVGNQIRKLDLASGLPSTVLDSGNRNIDCAAWSDDGGILFFLSGQGTARVPAEGGEATLVVKLAASDSAHLGFDPLPGAGRFLFYAGKYAMLPGEVCVRLTDRKDSVAIMKSDSAVTYAAPGYLLYLRGDSLVAQPFDAARVAVTGPPEPLIDRVGRHYGKLDYLPLISVSTTGVLVYRNGTRYRQSRLIWFDRTGSVSGTVGEPAEYTNPALSPDGRGLAVSIRDPQSTMRDIWIMDLVRGGGTRLTLGEADNSNAVWSHDGTRVGFTSSRPGTTRDLYVKSISAAAKEELLLANPAAKNAESWSPDGSLLSFANQSSGMTNIWFLPMSEPDRKSSPFRITPFREQDSSFSPDGHFIAYFSNESGRNEIFAQRLTPGGRRWQVSTHGGEEPQWRGDGKELFYVERDNLMAVDIHADGDTLSPGIPHPLFKVPPSVQHRNRYVATRDGQRFLVVVPEEQGPPPPPPIVVVNWPALLRKR
jgi:Tol biopolymer transport system component/predicted Ser/Thr protein kinase